MSVGWIAVDFEDKFLFRFFLAFVSDYKNGDSFSLSYFTTSTFELPGKLALKFKVQL